MADYSEEELAALRKFMEEAQSTEVEPPVMMEADPKPMTDEDHAKYGYAPDDEQMFLDALIENGQEDSWNSRFRPDRAATKGAAGGAGSGAMKQAFGKAMGGFAEENMLRESGKRSRSDDYDVEEEDPETVEKYPNIRKMLKR